MELGNFKYHYKMIIHKKQSIRGKNTPKKLFSENRQTLVNKQLNIKTTCALLESS